MAVTREPSERGLTHASPQPARAIPAARGQRTFLVLSQVYVPDPAAVGQQIADAAAELAGRGHRVIVLTANRGYDDPSVLYPSCEVIEGVTVRRLRFSSFGKRSILIRLLSGTLYILQVIVWSIFVRKVDVVVVSTVPPMISIAALVISALRRVPLKLWVMDLNPDQMIAVGILKATSPAARLLDRFNRMVLARAVDVIVLDRFMARRINRKLDVSHKLSIIPPWPLEDVGPPITHDENPFRKAHGLEGKLVVMYSGNHSPSNPILTVLAAAERLHDELELVFLSVGGGLGKKDVEAAANPNIRSLPYQPRAELKYSLSAADVHLVSVGEAMVGIVHPCKLYGAMAVARPILFLGPRECHVSDILDQEDIGWHIAHGDVDNAERVLRALLQMNREDLVVKGARARAALITQGLTKPALCRQLCDVLERGIATA